MRRRLVILALACAGMLLAAGTAQASSTYASAVVANPNLAGYWRLGERAAQADAEGITAADAVGAHSGTYHLGVNLGVPGALEGDADSAAHFGSPDGYVDIPYAAALNTPAFTLEAWVNLDVGPNGMILAANGAQQGTNSGYALENVDDFGRHQLGFQIGDGSTIRLLRGIDYAPDRWYYVAATYDGTTARLYVNGQVTQSLATGYVPDATYPLRVGLNPMSRSGQLAGSVDELAVYNTALSAASIQAHYQLGIDDGAPIATALTAAPSGVTNQTTATFTFTSPSTDATFQCQSDSGAWQSCTSPYQVSGLADGPHVMRVRAVNRAGRAGATPAEAQWTVDTVAPRTSLVAVPPLVAANTAATFVFSSEAGASFTCELDSGPSTSCTSPYSVSGLGDGPHTMQIQATDPAGNVEMPPTSYSWSVDTAPPSAFLTQAPTSQAPNLPFEFTSNAVGALFRCRVDGGAWRSCTSPFTAVPRGAGTHTFEVEAVDALGNVDPNSHAYVWTVPVSASLELSVAFPHHIESLAARRRGARDARARCHRVVRCVARKTASMLPRIAWRINEPAKLVVTIQRGSRTVAHMSHALRGTSGSFTIPDAIVTRLAAGKRYTAVLRASANGTNSAAVRMPFSVMNRP